MGWIVACSILPSCVDDGFSTNISLTRLPRPCAAAFFLRVPMNRQLTDEQTDPSPVSVPALMRELGNSPRGVSEGGA
jgi:hypothetical protein